MASCLENAVISLKNISTPPAACEKALPLIVFAKNSEDKNTRIQLNGDILTTVINRAGGRPLSIFCTSGPKRQDAMLVLNYMIKRLEALEMGETNTGWMEGNGNHSDMNLEGVRFQQDQERNTKGVWVWSRPFIVTSKDNKQIAVLLMDAHGTHDDFMTNKELSTVLGFSLLTSSVVICNLLSQEVPQESHTRSGQSSKQKPVFLIRDCHKPQETEIKDLDQTLNVEVSGKCFVEMDCFLKPDASDTALISNSPKLTPYFVKVLEELINGLLNCEILDTKKILGHNIPASDFVPFLERYFGLLNSNEISSADGLLDANDSLVEGVELLTAELKADVHRYFSRVQLEVLRSRTQTKMKKEVKERVEFYASQMKAEIDSKEFLSEQQLKETHERLQNEALQNFQKTVGSFANAVNFKMKLREEIQQRFVVIMAENTEKSRIWQSKLRHNVKQGYENYLNVMKTEFESLHKKTVQLSKEKFLEQCTSTLKYHPEFVKEHEKQLEAMVNAKFQNLNEALGEKATPSENLREEKARALMEECVQAAVIQIKEEFPTRVKFWVEKHLDANCIPEIKSVYRQMLGSINKEFNCIVSPKLWAEFKRQVDAQSKGTCFKMLENILESVQTMKNCLDGPHFATTPSRLEQVARDELLKITSIKTEDPFVMEILHLATERLLKHYKEQLSKKVVPGKSKKSTNAYNRNVKRHDPYQPQLPIDPNQAYITYGDEQIARAKQKEEKAFCTTCEEIMENMMKIYNEKTQELLQKFPDGIGETDFSTYHCSIQSEVMALMEKEIKKNVGTDVSIITNYKRLLKIQMESSWTSIGEVNKKNCKISNLKKLELFRAKEALRKKCQEINDKLNSGRYERNLPLIHGKILEAQNVVKNTGATLDVIQQNAECLDKVIEELEQLWKL